MTNPSTLRIAGRSPRARLHISRFIWKCSLFSQTFSLIIPSESSPCHDSCAHSPPRMSSWPWTCWAPPRCSYQSLAPPGLSFQKHSYPLGPGWDRNVPQQLVHLEAKLSEPLNKLFKQCCSFANLTNLPNFRVNHKICKTSLDDNILDSKHYCQI